MELMQQVKGNYFDSREEEEGTESSRLHEEEEDAGGKKVELMELSLGRNKEDTTRRRKEVIEKEHMFDKVVTPSDVGKLNRLVIPKQHAEKYFPLDSSSNEKGLLLNFEDRNGKMWRFRYSYWNSSQSYVMTKGWSRFVKEKKLDAGDTVSFQRGLPDFYRHRLYIDWRRRSDNPHSHPHVPDPPLFLPSSIRWYSLPPNISMSMPIPIPPNFTFHQQHLSSPTPSHNNNNHYADNINSGSAGSLYYLSSSISDQNFQARRANSILPMIIDSVPVTLSHHNRHSTVAGAGATTSSGKRLRLFGVNMECASSAEDSSTVANSSSLHHLRVPHEDPLSLSSPGFGDHKGMLFDLDPSLQYHRH